MACTVLLVLGVLALATLVSTAKLAPYIKPCVRTSPNFKECAIENGRQAAPFLIPGDRKNRVPVLDPLRISTMSIDNNGLILNLKDVDITGLSSATIKDVNVDFDKRIFSYQIFMSQCNLQSDYEAKGRISILPITGNGRMNLTFVDMDCTITLEYDIVKKGGKDYMLYKNDKMDYTMSRLYISLSNLFNGNKFLSDQMHQFFDDSWRDVMNEVGPAFGSGMSSALAQMFKTALSPIPFDEIFLKGP